jgi:DNA-binding CsgD family transcriptional regulator
MEDTELIEQCCRDCHAGLPAARGRLLALWESVLSDYEEHPYWGQTYIAFSKAVAHIADPKFTPVGTWTDYLADVLDRAHWRAWRLDKYVHSPSRRTVSRWKKAGIHVPNRCDVDTVLIGDGKTTPTERLRFDLHDSALTDRQAAVAQLLAAGHSYAEAGDKLAVSAKTVQRELEIIKRRVTDASAHALAV